MKILLHTLLHIIISTDMNNINDQKITLNLWDINFINYNQVQWICFLSLKNNIKQINSGRIRNTLRYFCIAVHQ